MRSRHIGIAFALTIQNAKQRRYAVHSCYSLIIFSLFQQAQGEIALYGPWKLEVNMGLTLADQMQEGMASITSEEKI